MAELTQLINENPTRAFVECLRCVNGGRDLMLEAAGLMREFYVQVDLYRCQKLASARSTSVSWIQLAHNRMRMLAAKDVELFVLADTMDMWLKTYAPAMDVEA
jgi:hypothetical protein